MLSTTSAPPIVIAKNSQPSRFRQLQNASQGTRNTAVNLAASASPRVAAAFAAALRPPSERASTKVNSATVNIAPTSTVATWAWASTVGDSQRAKAANAAGTSPKSPRAQT